MVVVVCRIHASDLRIRELVRQWIKRWVPAVSTKLSDRKRLVVSRRCDRGWPDLSIELTEGGTSGMCAGLIPPGVRIPLDRA